MSRAWKLLEKDCLPTTSRYQILLKLLQMHGFNHQKDFYNAYKSELNCSYKTFNKAYSNFRFSAVMKKVLLEKLDIDVDKIYE